MIGILGVVFQLFWGFFWGGDGGLMLCRGGWWGAGEDVRI